MFCDMATYAYCALLCEGIVIVVGIRARVWVTCALGVHMRLSVVVDARLGNMFASQSAYQPERLTERFPLADCVLHNL